MDSPLNFDSKRLRKPATKILRVYGRFEGLGVGCAPEAGLRGCGFEGSGVGCAPERRPLLLFLSLKCGVFERGYTYTNEPIRKVEGREARGEGLGVRC